MNHFKSLLSFVFAFALIVVLTSDASAIGRRNRGGNGGGMGNAAAGNGLCNMALKCEVRPNQCIGGDCGLPDAPAAAPAPAVGSADFGDEGPSTPARKPRADERVAKYSRVNFDAPVNSVDQLVRR